MTDVSLSELRKRGGDVVDRVARGEHVILTRAGKAVAELRQVSAKPLSSETLLARWHRLPALDPLTLRADIGRLLDAGF